MLQTQIKQIYDLAIKQIGNQQIIAQTQIVELSKNLMHV
ncbi:unnamed protein product [Paramecium octaurelia]|uniref:Uncharacterized protein n=1 Tax=Paramecium octaurelia TaxID=43137 RepID=A0A8S1VVY0_PAROT|nr:unnamed protein product [Paramecium octaurelia]